MMNRAERRRANRAMARAMRQGRAEAATIVASCGHGCGLPGSVVRAGDIVEASAKLRAHYAADHDGIEP